MTQSSSDSLFASRLKNIREERGLTQAQLAQQAGLQPSAIAHFEAERRKPSFENVRRLTKALGVSADFLLGVPTVTAFRDEDKLSPGDREHIQGLIDRLTGGGKAE